MDPLINDLIMETLTPLKGQCVGMEAMHFDYFTGSEIIMKPKVYVVL